MTKNTTKMLQFNPMSNSFHLKKPKNECRQNSSCKGCENEHPEIPQSLSTREKRGADASRRINWSTGQRYANNVDESQG